MVWVATAIIGSAVVGGVMSSSAQKSAAKTAANAQTQATSDSMAEQRRQFDSIQALFRPYVEAGGGALARQLDLVGNNGPEAQQKAIQAIEMGPEFAAMTRQGEEAILQNAAATGGLRGGNVQGALAQFRPALLNQFIDRVENQSAATIGQVFRARGNWDMTDRLASLSVPTLVVNGEFDLSLERGMRTAAMVPGAKHAMLPGTGHGTKPSPTTRTCDTGQRNRSPILTADT
jgi:pimeloyl-ACP methyl ester carboxylesterase